MPEKVIDEFLKLFLRTSSKKRLFQNTFLTRYFSIVQKSECNIPIELSKTRRIMISRFFQTSRGIRIRSRFVKIWLNFTDPCFMSRNPPDFLLDVRHVKLIVLLYLMVQKLSEKDCFPLRTRRKLYWAYFLDTLVLSTRDGKNGQLGGSCPYCSAYHGISVLDDFRIFRYLSYYSVPFRSIPEF